MTEAYKQLNTILQSNGLEFHFHPQVLDSLNWEEIKRWLDSIYQVTRNIDYKFLYEKMLNAEDTEEVQFVLLFSLKNIDFLGY